MRDVDKWQAEDPHSWHTHIEIVRRRLVWRMAGTVMMAVAVCALFTYLIAVVLLFAVGQLQLCP